MTIFEIILLTNTALAYSINYFMWRAAWKYSPQSINDTDEVIIDYEKHWGNPLTHLIRTLLLAISIFWIIWDYTPWWGLALTGIALLTVSLLVANLWLLVRGTNPLKYKNKARIEFWIAIIIVLVYYVFK